MNLSAKSPEKKTLKKKSEDMEEIREEEAISLVKTERIRRPSINTNDNLKHYNDILS